MSQSGRIKPDYNRSQSEHTLLQGNVAVSTVSLEDTSSDLRRSSDASCHIKRTKRNRIKERQNTHLLDAAQTADLDKCRRLIEEGADINAMCRDTGATVLMVSAAWGNDDLVTFLLEKEASPLISDDEGRTPAHIAAARGNEGVLRILLDSKIADQVINAQVSAEERRLERDEHFDSWIHQHDTLLPNMPDLSKGSTPLHAASQWSNSGCVRLLLDRGADTECRDERGLTPLDVAGEVVHRPDDCEHHEDGLGSMEPGDTDIFPSRSKKSSFVPFSVANFVNENEVLFDDKHKSTTRHVIEEILAKTRDNRIVEDIRTILPFHRSAEKLRAEELEYEEEVKEEKQEGDNKKGDNILRSKGMPRKSIRGFSGKKLIRKAKIKEKLKNCLHTAVKEGDVNLITYLIKAKFDYIFQLDENGCTPAHIAVEMMDLKVLSLLLDRSEAVDVSDSKGRSLLYRSAEIDWINGVDFLLNANSDITKRANDGSTVLHVAARKNNCKLLEELFTFDDTKKIVNEFDENKQTPLCCAIEESSVDCVEYLLTHEACATVVQPGELTLLHIAARKGSKEIMELLLRYGANILLDSYNAHAEGGMTPLHVSCKEGHVNCVRLLIQFRANVFNKTITKSKPYYGATPLHLAARYGRLDVADILIKFDRDVLDQRNADLWQPIHVAARFSKTECVRLFLKSGGNLASEVTFVGGYRRTSLDMIVNFIPQPVEFLQEIFDSYIYTNDYPLTHSNCIVTFKYNLFSPSPEENRKQLNVLDAVINSPKIVLQEILLLHPLAETFLFLKWKKLRIFFFLIFGIYCILTLSITAMCLTFCTDALPYVLSNLHFFRCTTIISLVFLATQEIFQASRLQRYYWTELESWVKWTTFVLAGWLILPDFRFNQEQKICYTNISSVAVLLSWVELLLLLSRLPNWGFSVLMFCRVAQNVLKVLATFAILFIGFMFSLMIEFRSQSPFKNLLQSFTKVIVMTSEIEYSDMFSSPVETGLLWSVVARFILLSFVILITIVLMNLMVGIAVNDISLLEAQGRTRRLAKQVSFLSLIEMFVYSEFFLRVFPRFLKKAIKNRRKVPLTLDLRTGKPHKHDMKIFPVSLRNSIMDKVSNMKKTDDKNDLKDLSDKIDKLISQQKDQIYGSSSSLLSDDSTKQRHYTLSMLKNVASTLQEVKLELNQLKNNFQPRRSLRSPKIKDALMKI